MYLVQEKHSSYGRDSLGLLKRSVSLLFDHYNAAQQDPVIFFHTGNFSESGQQQVLSLCGSSPATFEMLNLTKYWTVPADVDPRRWRLPNRFSAGYRNMCRFFLIGIWPLLHERGFRYMMRMDEDSFIWSPIKYNIFSFMQSRDLIHAYRLLSIEHEYTTRDALHAFMRKYALERGLEPSWLLESCGKPGMANFSIENCGPPTTPYNNFYVSNIRFWLREDVQDLLRAIDKTNWIYTARIGDHIWSAYVLKTYADPRRVHRFNDFAYEHITQQHYASTWQGRQQNFTCLSQGAFAIGSSKALLGHRALDRVNELFHQPLPLMCQNVRFCLEDPEHEVKWNRTKKGVGTRRFVGLPTGYFIGSVNDEQYSCEHTPKPYICHLPNHLRIWSTYAKMYHEDLGQGANYGQGPDWSAPRGKWPSHDEHLCRSSPFNRSDHKANHYPWPESRLESCSRNGHPTPSSCMKHGWKGLFEQVP